MISKYLACPGYSRNIAERLAPNIAEMIEIIDICTVKFARIVHL
jgi:hypothetical protein